MDRLCRRKESCCWLRGGVGVSHRTLGDFLVEQAQWVDEQLTRSMATLPAQRAVKMNGVTQEGLRIPARAKVSSSRVCEAAIGGSPIGHHRVLGAGRAEVMGETSRHTL